MTLFIFLSVITSLDDLGTMWSLSFFFGRILQAKSATAVLQHVLALRATQGNVKIGSAQISKVTVSLIAINNKSSIIVSAPD